MYTSQLLSSLAVAGLAAAQSSSICSQPTATINAQADVTQYASCSTISGDVVIGTGATDINLDGPQQITGQLIAHDAGNLITLGSTTLSSVGTMDLFNLTRLSTFSFGRLTSVNTISWNSLPALSTLTLPSVISSAKNVTILNTFLKSLEGINLATADSLEISDNNLLTSFSTQVANVTGSISIGSNGQALDLEFPNLIWASTLNIRNVSKLSIPSLSVVNNSFGLYENYFTTVNAPNLTTVGNFGQKIGSFAINTNSMLTNFSAPVLTSVGGPLQVENNTALSSVAFPKLANVGGALYLLGNFSTFSLPSVSNIQGGAIIESTNDIGSSCSSFKSSEGNAVQGPNTCTGSVIPSATSMLGASSTTPAGGSSASPSGKKNSAGRHGIEETVAGLSVIGALMQALL